MSPAPETDIAVLQQRVTTLEQRSSSEEEWRIRFEERQDKIFDRVFAKMDETAAAQMQSMGDLVKALQPIQIWAARMQGALWAILKIGGALTMVIGAVWGFIKFFVHGDTPK